MFLTLKSVVYHVLTSQEGSLVCFVNQEGTLARVLAPKSSLSPHFGSQEDTLARAF